jgi:hypothetical protein
VVEAQYVEKHSIKGRGEKVSTLCEEGAKGSGGPHEGAIIPTEAESHS